MKKTVIYTAFFCALAGALVSCATKPIPYERKNYSDENIRGMEIQRMEKSLEERTVAVLWQTKLILDMYPEEEAALSLHEKAEDLLISRLEKAVADKNSVETTRLYNSLLAIGSRKLSAGELPKNALKGFSAALDTKGSQQESVAPVRVSHMIRGTVTIWVDRGIKIERGMGYADRVIGSGFFIDSRGYIVTNYHVIDSEVNPKYEGFSRLYVRLADDPDTRIPARVVGWDPALDLALLKTEVDAPYVFTLGSSDDLDVGDRIYAIGSPVGLDKTLTSGIVSATERKLFSMGDVMQIDAAINSGNSGGPIIDGNGAVQGIVFAGIKPYEGLNFAIPVEYLKIELDRLQNGGKIEHSWFGAFGRTKRATGLSAPEGVEMLYLMPGGTAYNGGFSEGDVITSFNGEAITTIEQLKLRLLAVAPETIVKVGGLGADGTAFEKLLCTDTRPEYPGYEIYQRDLLGSAIYPIMGMRLNPVSDLTSKRFTVEEILKAGAADESGFSEMDYVEITKVRFSPDKDAMLVELYTKKRRSGYLDMFISLAAPLDSPNYF